MSAPASGRIRGGIDLGGTKIQAIVIDESHEVLGEARRPTPRDDGPEGVARAMAEAMGEATDAAGTQTDALKGVGVGSPGEVETKSGVVSGARNLPEWEGSFPLGSRLTEALGTKVAVGNDVGVATNAEAELGAGRHHSSILGVFWGTGVGGGIVLRGSDWHGRGGAGEIGHMVVKQGGARCPCGNRGCMEAYAGRSAMEAKARRLVKKGAKTELFELMADHGKPRLTSGIWEHALDRGDPVAGEADQARRQGARSRDRLRRQPARPRDRDPRRRPRHPLRRDPRTEDREAHAQEPLRSRAPAGARRRRARGPRRRDRRVAARRLSASRGRAASHPGLIRRR